MGLRGRKSCLATLVDDQGNRQLGVNTWIEKTFQTPIQGTYAITVETIPIIVVETLTVIILFGDLRESIDEGHGVEIPAGTHLRGVQNERRRRKEFDPLPVSQGPTGSSEGMYDVTGGYQLTFLAGEMSRNRSS